MALGAVVTLFVSSAHPSSVAVLFDDQSWPVLRQFDWTRESLIMELVSDWVSSQNEVAVIDCSDGFPIHILICASSFQSVFFHFIDKWFSDFSFTLLDY